MGKSAFGGTESQNVGLKTPEQERFNRSTLGKENTQLAGQAYNQFLQGPQGWEGMFQQSVIDPALMNYQRQVLPQIQQRFADVNAGSSSALNQALASSATDLESQLAQQYMNFYNQQQQNQLNALSQLQGQASQRNFEPVMQQKEGWFAPVASALGDVAAAYFTGGASIPGSVMKHAMPSGGQAPGGQSSGPMGFGRGFGGSLPIVGIQ